MTGGVKGRCLPPPAGLLFLSASHPALRRSSGAGSGPGMRLFPQRFITPGILSRPRERPRERPAAVGRGQRAALGTGGGSGDSATPRAGLTHRTVTAVHPQGSSDPHPVLTAMLGWGGLVLGSLCVYLIPFYLFLCGFVTKKGGTRLIDEFVPGSRGAGERHCH